MARAKKSSTGLFTKLLILISIVALYVLSTVRFDWKDQAMFGVATFALALWINRISRAYTATLLLMVLSLFSTTRYAYWRFTETYRHLAANDFSNLDGWLIFPALLLLAEAYAILVHWLGCFGSLKPLDRPPVPLPREVDQWPKVDVYIPSYNEPLDVVRPTVLAAMRIDWPADKIKVYILDDGRRDEFRAFAEECGCGYLIRSDNKGAKAGNINRAMERTDGEFIAIFDCDHIPTRSFLQMTVGWFLKDPDLAMVQTPHYFYTPDPFEKNLGTFGEVPNEGALFYGVVQNCSDFWNATFFCGSCATIRRKALEEVGGVAVETVTEDAHTALKMQRRGWNTAYLRFPLAAGLATSSLADHIGQRIRWARGMIQILRIDCPLFGRGLKLPQRLCYLNSTLHYLYGLPRLIFLTSPLVYLLLNRSNVYGYVATILAYAFPHLAMATMTNSRIQGRYRHSFWNEVYETVLAPYILIPTTLALISPKHGKFNVTPKSHGSDKSYFAWKAAMPLLVLLGLNVTGIILGGLRLVTEPERQGALLMNMFWALLNVMILGASVAVAAERRQRRTEARLERHYDARLILGDNRVLAGETTNMSNGGAAVQLGDAAEIAAESGATLLVTAGNEECALNVTVVECKGAAVRLRFEELNMAQREFVTRLIFGAADLWLTGLRAKEFDRPGQSFLRILKVSLRGIAMVPTELFSRDRHEDEELVVPSSRRRRGGGTAALLALAGLVFGVHTARAADPVVESTPVEMHRFEEVRDFRVLGERMPLVLRGAQATTAISFSLPLSKVATEAHLGLTYQLAPQLDGGKSELQVVLNGSPVGSMTLERGTGQEALSHAEIAIPAELLLAQNTLAFQLKAQCAGGACPTDADIRTSIDLSSSLRLAGEVIPWPNDLSLLPSPFFDPTLQQAVELSFYFPSDADRWLLKSAGLVASYFGALADHRGLRFPVSRSGIPKGNVVVLAVAGLADLAMLHIDTPAGPTIAVRDNPSDASGKLLILAGRDSAQVLTAAQAFALGQAAQKGDAAQFDQVVLPRARKAYDTPKWLRTGRITRIGDVVPAEQLRDDGAGHVHWYFRLPPDLHLGQRGGVPMRLHFRYAPLDSDARAEARIKINGIDVAVKRFRGGTEAESIYESFEIPEAALYPRNTLSIEFQSTGGRRASAPVASILKDSQIDLTKIPHFVTLPRLDLFAKAGYPFTRVGDLSETAVVLNNAPLAEEIRAYLELMGFFAAQTGTVGVQVEVLDPQQALHAPDRDLLVIGMAETHSLFVSWNAQMPVRVRKTDLGANRPESMWLRLWSFPFTRAGREFSRLVSMLAGDGTAPLVMQGFVSPINPHRSVVAISATNPAALEQLVDGIERSIQDEQIYGTVSLQQGNRFASFRLVDTTYTLGELGWQDAIDYWVYEYMWLVPLALLLLASFIASVTSSWVDRRTAERLRGEA